MLEELVELTSTEAPGAGLRVLVVDDDPDINRLLQIRLRTRGYDVASAASGDEALARMDELCPDVILLDVSMPGASGLDVLEQVRADGRDIAVIMSTAFGSENVAIDALRRGADDYLRKPFVREEFQTVVDRTVSRLVLRRQNVQLRAQLDEKRRQLEAEFARAAEVQARLLPSIVPSLPGFDLAARCLPAHDVGGDFYDWQTDADGSVTITLGDVMGKGMPAALLMATVRAALRAIGPHRPPAEAVAEVNRALHEDLSASGSFVTLFHGRLDPASLTFRFVDAGHGHVAVQRHGGDIETLQPGGLPIGITAAARYDEGCVTFAAGDALILFSDGLIDACPELADTPAALKGIVDGAADAATMVDRLIALGGSAGMRTDDLTALVLLCHQPGS